MADNGKPTLLLVDDTPANLKILVDLLKHDYRTLVAGRGDKALVLAKSEKPDLILLDIMMPEMDGYEVCQRLKGDPATASIPVIFVTAMTEADDEFKGFEMGAVDYIAKPFNHSLVQIRVKTHVTMYLLRREIEERNRENERLLLNVLPVPIAERIKAGEEKIVDRVESASLLFADLVGFTNFCSEKPPEAIIDALNALFTGFDRIVTECGAEKVKTIGDCYMAAAGVPIPCADHAQRIARAALRMRDVMPELAKAFGTDIKIRIGIHTGPIVAGIVGTTKFAYDMWGDTVNMTSRMESHGAPGMIQVSPGMAEALRAAGGFKLEPRGTVPIRGKGDVSTYWLLSASDS